MYKDYRYVRRFHLTGRTRQFTDDEITTAGRLKKKSVVEELVEGNDSNNSNKETIQTHFTPRRSR